MLGFGDELTLESYKIPWLIWIQLIVLFLLLVLVFSFTIFALDHPSHDTATATATASASTTPFLFDDIQQMERPLANHDSTPTVVTNRLQNTLGGENLSIKGEIETSASTRIVREEIAEGEASSLYFLHPCHYFRLAGVAFLKCLGLDSTSESDSPTTQKHRKRKES